MLTNRGLIIETYGKQKVATENLLILKLKYPQFVDTNEFFKLSN